MANEMLSYLFGNILFTTAEQIPNLLGTFIGALLILLFGWIMGRIIGNVVREVLKKLRVDDYFKVGKKISLTEGIAFIVSWIIYLAFISAVVSFLNIESLTKFFEKMTIFLGEVLGGIIIFVVGYVIANYVRGLIESSKVAYSKLLSDITFFFILIVVAEMAFKTVGVPTQLIDGIILILVGSLGLGLAIAIGLGMKSTVERLSKKYFKDK